MDKTGRKKEKRVGKRAALHAHIKGHKGTFVVYLVLRLLVTFLAVWSLISGNYENFFLCILSLILFFIPSFVSQNFGIQLPETLEIIVLLFIFAAEILGEISSFYVRISFWDTMLHTINGFLCAAIGFALVDILNRSTRFRFQLSPLFLAVVAFCFSMTVGVVWEFFEFFMDQIFLLDMQKDFVVNTISSAMLGPADSAAPDMIQDIVDTVIITADGTQYHLSDFGIHGYLDIGIIDTMKDLIVNFIGAFVFSIIGFFYVKSRGRGSFARRFIPTLREKNATQQQAKEEKEDL
ncbi:MAG: MFS transporter [Clostridiales bacterium]|jgi:hypothetical protein|nr:MFS transporter [Clostridiales bacterium]